MSEDRLLVTGDVVLDRNFYAGGRMKPDMGLREGTRMRLRAGGAALCHAILEEIARQDVEALKKAAEDAKKNPKTDTKSGVQSEESILKPEQAFLGLDLDAPETGEPVPESHIYTALWELRAIKNVLRWRSTRRLGFGAGSSGPRVYPRRYREEALAVTPRVCVLDDGMLGYRYSMAKDYWPHFLKGETQDSPDWILLKMAPPLMRSDLWRTLSAKWQDKLVVLVSADSLRREEAQLARGLSWESTVDDLLGEIYQNPRLRGLLHCRHLVVTLRHEAALWMDLAADTRQRSCCLVYDREHGEGDQDDDEGGAYGYHSAMLAALAHHFWRRKKEQASETLYQALKRGLMAYQCIHGEGHGPHKNKDGQLLDPDFPAAGIARAIREEDHKNLAISRVPCAEKTCCANMDTDLQGHEQMPSTGVCFMSREEQWTMLGPYAQAEQHERPGNEKSDRSRKSAEMQGPARLLALKGPAMLPNAPLARFGKLLTMDRHEIESLRTLRKMMLDYKRRGSWKKPLSLAVFGAPGSGKSFGLKQIAAGVFGERNPILEFNLSQFKGPEDLIGALHQVRDAALSGSTPVVFWDEFDTANYHWLQYLLAPMQDGAFQEGQVRHPIGKSVFVFAGGTSIAYEYFGPPEECSEGESDAIIEARKAFRMAKGPDFKSRIDAYYNVDGPNCRQRFDWIKALKGESALSDDPEDRVYPIRRALLLRSMLGYFGDRENSPLDIDPGILRALLRINRYRHGARSMSKLIDLMQNAGKKTLLRSNLPPDHILELYVDDVPEFHRLVNESQGFAAEALELAPKVHENYYNNLEPKEQKGKTKHYEDLSDEEKASNIAAARRIPDILALANLLVSREETEDQERAGQPVSEDEAVAIVEHNLEKLAEAEHEGWMREKIKEGWLPGPERSNEQRIHDLLVPYQALPEEQKDKDRNLVKAYPKIVIESGYQLFRNS